MSVAPGEDLQEKLAAYLGARGLAKGPQVTGAVRPQASTALLRSALLRLCHDGRLTGGLSIALDLAPDELIGPLCHALGGEGRRLKVLDSFGGRRHGLEISFKGTERWELEGSLQLVDRLNSLFEEEPTVKACAVLGEWEDMLQLWCVPKAKLPALLAESFFLPENRPGLERLLGA